jgi:DNA (cytosine-5)-methyltransferase 1
MKVIELFCGIGGFRVASDNLQLNTVWANDIDLKAAEVYIDNFGKKEIVIGDIQNYYEKIPKHDLLTAGFPCQPFSSAGKKKGTQDYRGTQFENIAKIIKKYKPNYFILENVKRLLSMDNGSQFKTILKALSETGYYLEWKLLNALDFDLPQNRQRIFITGTKKSKFIHHKLLTKSEFSSIDCNSKINFTNYDLWNELENKATRFKNWGVCFNENFFEYNFPITNTFKKIKLIDILQNANQINDAFYFSDEDNLKRISNSVRVDKYYQGVELLYNQEGGRRLGYTIFGVNGCSSTLTSSTSRHYERYCVDGRMRRLTNVEYARLQGFDDDHCKTQSISKQYILYGNAIPPIMVEWVIKRMLKKTKRIDPQPTLFSNQL